MKLRKTTQRQWNLVEQTLVINNSPNMLDYKTKSKHFLEYLTTL